MHVNSNHLTLKKVFEKVEHYMRILMFAAKTKRKLNTIIMHSNKSVNKYYHRLFKLWEDANISVDNCMKKFKLTLKLNISYVLLAKRHNSLRKLLATAKSIEKQKKEISINFLQNSKPSQKSFKP